MRSLITTLVATFCFVVAGPALAVDNLGLFELDGNAVDDSGTPLPDDWKTLYDSGLNTGGNSFVFTGIEDDPAPNSIFDGGKKDIQDVSQWSGGDGSVPDKGDITNAYAAAYKCPEGKLDCEAGDLIVYFGADRVSNNGDAFLGFWFFKDAVSYDPDTGDFSGNHMPGDTLVLVNFPQASNAVPEIRVVEWDTTCSKAANNSPVPGQCAAKNLRLVADGAVCGNGGTADACAVTNAVTEEAPWPFLSKNADPAFPTDFPFESFFEGGINLSKVVGEGCFASFMAETRSSSSFTAALKDFVLDQFPVCAVELSKECGTGTFNAATGNLEIPYDVTVTNTGAGNVAEIIATDNGCGFGSSTLNFGPLGPGISETKSGTCSIPAGTDLTSGISNGVSAIADGGDTSVVLADSCVTDPGSPGTCFSDCAFNLDPAIAVSKSCVTALAVENEMVTVKVNFSGTVTNTSDQTLAPVPLSSVAVSDSEAGPLTLLDGSMNPLPTPVWLDPGESANFMGSYFPDGTGLGFSTCPSDASFADTVTASGVDVFVGETVTEMATATCELCPPDGCPTP